MLRGKPNSDGPWCWQSKAALRRIQECLDGENTVSSGLAVYVALTQIASDEQSSEFRTTHAHISKLSGVKDRTVRKRLDALVDIGLIQIETPELRAPCTYRLLPFGINCRTFGNGCVRHPMPTSEEKEESRTHASGTRVRRENLSAAYKGEERQPPPRDANAKKPPAGQQRLFPSERRGLIADLKAELKEIYESAPGSKFRDTSGQLKPEWVEYRQKLIARRKQLETESRGFARPE